MDDRQRYPKKQGLYDPAFEHDACGMGFVAHIGGRKSYDILDDALTVLENLSHRGASGSDEHTGDGAGVLTQIPHALFERDLLTLGITLPSPGHYGVGMVFAHPYEDFRKRQMAAFEEIVRSEGQRVLCWREVPIDFSAIGEGAKTALPRFIQVFVEKSPDLACGLEFERKLYQIRKLAEKTIPPMSEDHGGIFYFSSLSSRTIVYKGMLTASQLRGFYLDLSDLDYQTALAMVHSRFSTNTFPSWERAHPNRFLVHNGEINTIRGNVNWMKARSRDVITPLFDDVSKICPVIDESGSDSSMFDNCLEFLYLTGRSLPEAAMMMIPEPWEKNPLMSPGRKAFYQYHSFLMEPWDGPAAMAFSDGELIGAMLDRNGLRPCRYYVTRDERVILSSEVGVLDIKPENVKRKGRLEPGKMLLVDTLQGRIIADEELKDEVSSSQPWGEWAEEHIIPLRDLPSAGKPPEKPVESLVTLQKAFGYTQEDIYKYILPMASQGEDPVGSMGMDTPLAALSDKPQMLYLYFKQLFAQVTNPPIDGIREDIVTSSAIYLGAQGHLLKPDHRGPKSLLLPHPILTEEELETIRALDGGGLKAAELSLLYRVSEGSAAMEKALNALFDQAIRAIHDGANILVLTDRGTDAGFAAIPALLACSGLHHELIRRELRTGVGLVLESAEPREVHHFCALVGYGVTAICPYLAFETIRDLEERGILASPGEGQHRYIKAAVKGMMKVMSKMGISTMQSYQGAQIFEAVGVCRDVIDRYFTQTPTRLEGIGIEEIHRENQMRHESAYALNSPYTDTLESGGIFQYKADGEEHLYSPETIYLLQRACREGDYSLYKAFSKEINEERLATLRGMLDFKFTPGETIPIEKVEPVENIVRRFKTGAMSYGSLSREAHECLAIAMNRLGGRSNSGEGGEDPARFLPLPNGDSKNSAIKQVASGRFGVTSAYLTSAKEIQIKMAQGAKPGEGGQLPGRKVYPEIAGTRHATPGVELISPPPHHDIYSIEDLAELIHDLKNANHAARINVKLVSEVGVGTIAAGVAKGKADVILISKMDLISRAEREELKAILQRLNAEAEILPMVMGEIALKKILDTRRFDFERAAQSPGWLKEMRGEHVPETQEYGIASTVYRAVRPFHPERFFNVIDRPWTNGKLLRSKGFFWLASKYQEAGSWSQAGGLMRYGYAGRWWRFVPQDQWPEDAETRAEIFKKWLPETADCRQELVFIGQHIDFNALTVELDACLLTDAEVAMGPEAWLQLSDPFGDWYSEVAA